MAPDPSPPLHPDDARDAATRAITGAFLAALGVSVLAGYGFAERWIDRALCAGAGGALLLCGALFLWLARAARRRGSR